MAIPIYTVLPYCVMRLAIISQCGSTVYIGIAMGGPALWPYIRKFQFQLSFKDIKVENM